MCVCTHSHTHTHILSILLLGQPALLVSSFTQALLPLATCHLFACTSFSSPREWAPTLKGGIQSKGHPRLASCPAPMATEPGWEAPQVRGTLSMSCLGNSLLSDNGSPGASCSVCTRTSRWMSPIDYSKQLGGKERILWKFNSTGKGQNNIPRHIFLLKLENTQQVNLIFFLCFETWKEGRKERREGKPTTKIVSFSWNQFQ